MPSRKKRSPRCWVATVLTCAAASTAAGAQNYAKIAPTGQVPLSLQIQPTAQGDEIGALALLNGASAQLRNQATTAGNLLQRTRCPYFYDVAMPCNKRQPGSGCSALQGFNRMHAILGASDQCIAVYPGDLAIALVALDASIDVQSTAGGRTLKVADLHREPGQTPDLETALRPDELILRIRVPKSRLGKASTYLKIRDRLSYAFALVSVAVGLELEGGRIGEARFALGGVAHKPWRNAAAEAALRGRPADAVSFAKAADLVLGEAKGFGHNSFKIDLAHRAIIRALTQAAAGTPQSQSNKKIA